MGRFHRAIGVVIFGAALLGAVLLGAAIALTSRGARSRPDDGLLFGVWKVVYDTQAPSPRVIMAAFGLALVAAAPQISGAAVSTGGGPPGWSS